MSATQRSKTKKHKDRPTIGMLINLFNQNIINRACAAVMDVAHDRDVNVIFFPAGWMPTDWLPGDTQVRASATVLFDFISKENVDGVISLYFWPTDMGNMPFYAFADAHPDLPIVDVLGIRPENEERGIPSIVPDDYGGMKKAVNHLIEEHDRQRIAFIRGPAGGQSTDERYRGYADALVEHNISINPDLIVTGYFSQIHGREAIHSLIDLHRMRPQVDFDALVAANDDMAIGAMDELQERGIRIPYEMLVAGFDNQQKFSTPPLTTVNMPAYELGWRAAETLLSLLENEPVPQLTTVPAHLVKRESCGCTSQLVQEAAIHAVLMPQKPKGKKAKTPSKIVSPKERQRILGKMMQSAPYTVRSDIQLVERLWDGLFEDLESQNSHSFLNNLDFLTHQSTSGEEIPSEWQSVISVMREELLPYLEHNPDILTQAESLWQQGRMLINEIIAWTHDFHYAQENRRAEQVEAFKLEMLNLTSRQELIHIMAQQLQSLRIPAAYLSLYENPKNPISWATLTMAYEPNQGRMDIPPEGIRYPTKQLLPKQLQSQDKQFTHLVQPLYFWENQIGFIVFQVSREDLKWRNGAIFDILQWPISGALYNTQIVSGIEYQAKQLQTAAEVSSTVGSILDPEELIQRIVQLIKEQFDLYYVGLFMVDRTGQWSSEPGQWAVLRAATGEAGQKMLERGHKLSLSPTSMIGWCITNGEARIAMDVGAEAVRFENPDLPLTHSEIALPLRSRGQTIGAITIQSEKEAAFTKSDLTIMQTLADQVSVAIDNARLFSETEQAIKEMQVAQERYLQHRWTGEEDLQWRSGYERRETGIHPLDEWNIPGLNEALEKKEPVTISIDDHSQESLLIVPIILREQPIGALGLKGEKKQWDPETIAMVQTIANRFASAAENLRLLSQTQSRAAREYLAREISDKMRQASDVEDILKIAVDELFEKINPSRVFIQLGTETFSEYNKITIEDTE